ncbi:MAG: GGDEF domain-containing protein [Candidatus Omnitrophica bacterium]|nr:GGDEF domain-containing protein [Candidatus Omnitrophota bacterium]MDD5737119.1 GGDEF domain-containing protein [Candidatus Omnitrophota bacterium]
MKKRNSLLVIALMMWASAAQAGVVLKMTAENPSQYESRDVSVRSFLPSGVKPENIINNGGLEVAYDVKQGKYYVFRDVNLGPQESVTFEIEVEDIWKVDEAYLASLTSHAKDLSEKLRRTEYSAVSSKLNEMVSADAAAIIKRQDASGTDKVVPVEHINAYEANKALLDKIRRDVGTMENLVIGLGKDAGKIMGDSSTGSRSLDEIFAEAGRSIESSGLVGQSAPGAGKPKTIILKIEVTNPSKSEARRIPVNYYLPPEIRKDDIVDAKELEPRLDIERSVYYMHHPGVELGPGESRVFEITVKDKWSVSEQTLQALKKQAEALAELASSTKADPAVDALAKEVADKIDAILGKQASLSDASEYYSQRQQVADIQRSISKMEGLLKQAGVSEERLKKIQDMMIEGKSDYGTGPDPKGVKLLAGTIFKGKAPSTATTWKIIYIILICLGVMSAIFYFSQVEQRQMTLFDQLTGAFSRKYINEKIREEVKVAKAAGIECSLLLLDVDKFKNINDTYGHAVGDVVLKEFVIAIRKSIRATDPVGRFGGDEFLVVLPTANKTKAADIAENMRKGIEGHIIKIEDKAYNVTSSIGVATYPGDADAADGLFNKADKAMYDSKAKGGNAVTANV